MDWHKNSSVIDKTTKWATQQGAALTHWAKAQPGWRLVLYGIGGPLAAGIGLVLVLSALIWLGAFGALPSYPELKNIHNHQASEIYSEDGIQLGKYYIENRTDATLDEISPLVIQGLVATEDARFFEHSGIDLRAWGRVIVKSILLQDESSGGGSTLSQQLAKNLFPRRNYALLGLPINKLREMFVARRLENTYDKEELLRMYLNTVPFGENAFGIKVAAFRFFNKSAEHLKAEEAALLVGMLKGTSLYNPRRNPDQAQERRNVVLRQLVKAGHLPAAELDSLCQLPVLLDFKLEGHNEGMATYFREHLRQEVLQVLKDKKKADGSAYNLYTDGLKIYTTINSRMQRHAEAAVAYQMPLVQARFAADWRKRSPWSDATLRRALLQTPRYQQLKERRRSEAEIEKSFATPVAMTIFDWKGGAVDTLLSPLDSLKHYLMLLNVGLLSVEPATGLVRAWVGGIDHRFIQYDHVKSKRPVGSTFKPIVYAAALQSGMMPCEYTENQLHTYDQFKGWQPQNSDGKYGGAYSLAGALSNSVNTVAVELALRAGLKNVRQLARDMGVSSDIPLVPAIALGAVDASLIDMVTVYATLANRGYRPDRLHYLDKIVTADGEVLATFPRPNGKKFVKVLEPGHADMMLNLLQSVVDSGTAQRLRSEFGIQGTLMGKTGTTQEQGDGWFVGFNSQLVTGVWVGADQPGIHFRTLSNGQASRTALPIFGSYTVRVYKDAKFKKIRQATYPEPPEMVLALLECPPYLPELPVVGYEDAPVDQMVDWNRTIESIDPVRLQEVLTDNPRRDNENLSEYAERIRRLAGRDERREERRDYWGKVFFGKKEDGGG
ncbi:MAG: penicillin-binding protein [Bacteroidetes bacterium]|nr:MAG: penicillin-binding protein [Bacteroidota bacterium]